MEKPKKHLEIWLSKRRKELGRNWEKTRKEGICLYLLCS
jgi:hypothetical protein